VSSAGAGAVPPGRQAVLRVPVPAAQPHREPGAELWRGSLIDTIVRLESDRAGSLWTSALDALADIDLARRSGVHRDPGRGTDPGAQVPVRTGRRHGIGVHPSDLTREHLRVFMHDPARHLPVPFSRLSTGALNVLVRPADWGLAEEAQRRR